MISARKSLQVFRKEWDNCTSCGLGARRQSANEKVIHGQGAQRRMMVVLEAPTWAEEKNKDVLCSDGGTFLSAVLKQLGLLEHVYVTYSVLCRSCRPDIDPGTGLPRTRRGTNGLQVPAYRDIPPTNDQLHACKKRLHEEIYLVDPAVILACGATAASAVLGKLTTLASIRGEPMHIAVEGAGRVASVTEKRRSWARTVRGETTWPTLPSSVRYLMVPTYDPLFVYRQYSDQRANSPGSQFTRDITVAAEIMTKYQELTAGTLVEAAVEPDDEVDEEDTYDE